jgi:hypothetical protein
LCSRYSTVKRCDCAFVHGLRSAVHYSFRGRTTG